jgi:DNA-binding transcriptional regulator PaaX
VTDSGKRWFAGLAPAESELLRLIVTLVDERREAGDIEPCFTQRQLRETFGWGDFAIRRHLARLVELEWVQVSRGPGNRRRYQLVDDGTNLSRIPDLARPSER